MTPSDRNTTRSRDWWRGLEGSLPRLDTDHVELIQCHIHAEEPNTDVFIEGFRQLKGDGKVLAWGVSTGEFAHVERFNADGDCDALQIDYSILNRIPEAEIFPYCETNGIGVIVRGPLAMGLLTDKFSAADTFPEGDFRRAWIEDPDEHQQFLADLATWPGSETSFPRRTRWPNSLSAS
jgi:aryl-alcohol dehydrogenase-like predicted oxidoreductase